MRSDAPNSRRPCFVAGAVLVAIVRTRDACTPDGHVVAARVVVAYCLSRNIWLNGRHSGQGDARQRLQRLCLFCRSINLLDVIGTHGCRLLSPRMNLPAARGDERGFDDEETATHPGGAIDCHEAGPFMFGSDRAEAMVTAPPLGQAAQSVNPIEKRPAGGWVGAACACSHAIIMRLPLRSVRKHYAACQPVRSMG